MLFTPIFYFICHLICTSLRSNIPPVSIKILKYRLTVAADFPHTSIAIEGIILSCSSNNFIIGNIFSKFFKLHSKLHSNFAHFSQQSFFFSIFCLATHFHYRRNLIKVCVLCIKNGQKFRVCIIAVSTRSLTRQLTAYESYSAFANTIQLIAPQGG